MGMEEASETTSRKTKAHVLTKGFHESDRAKWYPGAKEMLGAIEDRHANPKHRYIQAGRTQSLNNLIMFYFVLYQFARRSFL